MAVLTRLRMSAKLENLGRLIGALSDCAKTQGFRQEKISKIELATEEALVNVFRYAYPEQPGDVEMICRLKGKRLAIQIVDSEIPFDATAMPDPKVADG